MEIGEFVFIQGVLHQRTGDRKGVPPMDLTNQEKRSMKTLWVNVYRARSGRIVFGEALCDQLAAEMAAKNGKEKPATEYLCTCPIEIPDLEGK